jgi:RNA polymerase sigma-32 factor
MLRYSRPLRARIGGTSLAQSAGMATALDAYFDELRRQPLLSREEEGKLTRRYRRRREPEIADRLAVANLRLVVKIARQYRWSHQDLADLVAEGNHGLVLAISKFEPRRGARLSTYAAFWIRAYIMRFIVRNWRLVRVGTTSRQRRLMSSLRRVESELEKRGCEPTVGEIAEVLGMDVDEVAAFRRHIGAPEVALDAPTPRGARPTDLLVAADRPDATVEQREMDGLVRAVVSDVEGRLDARDRHILRARWFADERATLEELGAHFGVTRERARQLERRVLDRLRVAMDEKLTPMAA